MSTRKGKKRAGKRAAESGGPSRFFIIALALGVALLLWAGVRAATTKAAPPAVNAAPTK